jgi:hypothetical protein
MTRWPGRRWIAYPVARALAFAWAARPDGGVMTVQGGNVWEAEVLLAVKVRYALAALRIANGALALAWKLPRACLFRGFGISYPGALVLSNSPGFGREFQLPGDGALVTLAAAFAPRPGSGRP